MSQLQQHKGMRVLVAEDNVINQRVIEAMLEVIGITPLVVADGAAALAEVERAPFDLILTDIEMPVMDGLTAIERIRDLEESQQRTRTPVYVISSAYDAQDMHASAQAGADGHFAKPLRIPVLMNAVLEGLVRRKSNAERHDLAHAVACGAA